MYLPQGYNLLMPENDTEDAGAKLRKKHLAGKVAELAWILSEQEGRELSESEALERAVSEYLAWRHQAPKPENNT